MVDEVVTRQELIDAQKDAQSLDDFINGSDEQIVVTRLLKEYPTLANAIRQIYEKGGKFYSTLAAANADIANIRTDAYVITGDNGAYYKATAGATSLTKSPYDPLTQAKADATTKANAAQANAIAAAATDATIKANAAQANAITAAATDATTKANAAEANAIATAATDATTKANAAEANAKSYSDEFKVAKKSLQGVEVSTETSTMPIIVDSKNSVIFGYDENSDSLYGQGIVEQKSFDRLYIAENQDNIYPLIVDANNNVIFGYDYGTHKLFGDGLNQLTQPDMPLGIQFDNTDVNHMIGYGQSLSIGVNSGAPISTTQPLFNLTFSDGPRKNTGTLTPLVEETVETLCSGMANTAALYSLRYSGFKPNTNQIFSSTAGVGGYRIDQLKKGTTAYTKMLTHVTNAKNLIVADSKTFSVKSMVYVQGEQEPSNGISDSSLYVAALRTLASDFNTDAKAITGQNSKIPMLIHQIAIHADKQDGYIQRAQLEAGTNNDDIFLVTPIYMLPHSSDGVHLRSLGYKWMGAYFGRAYSQIVAKGIRPKQLIPLGVEIVGSRIAVNFSVPHSPLVLDAVSFPLTKDYGFAVKVDGVFVEIASISTDFDSVIIELVDIPTNGSTIEVRYALDYLATGINIPSGATGNLHDSCDESVLISGESKSLFYWAPNFKLNVYKGVI